MKTRAQIVELIVALEADIPALVARTAPSRRMAVFAARAAEISRGAGPDDIEFVDKRLDQTSDIFARRWAALR